MKYTVVKCLNCKTVFYKEDFNKQRSTKHCECGNVTMSTQAAVDNTHSWYVTVSHSGERPDIYETNDRDDT